MENNFIENSFTDTFDSMVSGLVLYLLGPVAMYVLGPGTFSLLADNAEQKIAELSSRNNDLIEDLTRMKAAKVSKRI